MVTHLLQRRPPLRVAYNGAMFALSALVAGLAVEHIHGDSVADPRRAGRGLRVPLLLGRQPHPDQRHPRCELRPLVLHDREGEHHADDGAVRVHGLGGADADRPLAAPAHPVDRARRPAAGDRPLPALDSQGHAGDATRADRPAHGSRQPPQLPRAPSARARRRRARGLVARALPRRLRRPEERQRPLRTPRRRSRARPGRVAPAAGRRVVPARRRRVRGAPAAAGRAAGDGRCALDRRARRCARHRGRRPRDRERRRRDVPDARLRARRADPARGQRVVLGEEGRQEPRPRLRGRVDPAGEPRADRGHTGPGRAVPGGGEPGEGGRRARRLHREPFAARRRLLGANRAPPRRGRRRGRADPARRQPPRPRQARDPGRGPPQAERAERGGAAHARAASADRLPDAREPRRRSPSRSGSSITTSGGTARAIRTVLPATRSRSGRGSSSSPTPTTR